MLKTGGVYLMISHGAPDNRVNHIKRYIDVDIDVIPIRKFLCAFALYSLPQLTPIAPAIYIMQVALFFISLRCVVVDWSSFLCFLTAKPDLKGVDESDEACYHYMYVLAKNSS
mgnify:CR=1 FL=1